MNLTIEKKLTLRQALPSDFWCERKRFGKWKKNFYFGRPFVEDFRFKHSIIEFQFLNPKMDLQYFAIMVESGEIYVPFSISNL